MKKLNFFGALLIGILILPNLQASAQESSDIIIEISTRHWNLDNPDGNMADWTTLAAEYHEKVIMKNEFITASATLTHLYTADLSEVLSVSVFDDWAGVDKASDRNRELAMEAWPDSVERRAFFQKLNAYYSGMHSDELYSNLPFHKFSEGSSDESQVIYIKKSRAETPEGGSGAEIRELAKEYVENVLQKNDDITAYHPMRHLYGSDSRDLIEYYVFESLSELESFADKNQELAKAHWSVEEERKEFFKKYNGYRSFWHGDYIYSTVPELNK